MIVVVLVSPEGEENVGAATRAIMNMDADELRLVKPACNYLSEKTFHYAVHAGEILKKTIVFQGLKEAIKDADLSIGLSRRIGQWRKQDFILPELPELMNHYQDKKVALVFGREKSGLSNEEIRLCDVVCSIPSSKNFPSLNLAQAVMVTLYEAFKARSLPVEKEKKLAERKDFDTMLGQMLASFDEMEFFKNVPSWRLESYIRKILIRAKLDRYDTIVIKNLFSRIKGIVQKLKNAS